jgi:hypothetical protein
MHGGADQMTERKPSRVHPELLHVYQKIGELISHIGLYDMLLLGIACDLTDEPVLKTYARKWSLDQRYQLILQLLKARNVPDALVTEFKDIHNRMKPILDRRSLIAHNPAFGMMARNADYPEGISGVLIGREWIERAEDASPEEMVHSIAEIEADCKTAAAHSLIDINWLEQKIRAAVGKGPPFKLAVTVRESEDGDDDTA